MWNEIKAPLRRFRAYRALRFAWHFGTDSVFRCDYLMRVRRPENLFQFRSFTAENRYPEIFSFVRDRLAQVPRPRLLSFGCATGEEVFSLRSYFPAATLVGLDINGHDIRRAEARRRSAGDDRIVFAQRNSAAGEAPESYDAVFCMAVFQHRALRDERIATCEKYIRFAAFDATLAGLSRSLKPGGYLAIRYMNFRFEDAACSSEFAPVLSLAPGETPHPRFDRHNRRLPSEAERDVVFQKRRAAA